MSKYDFEIDLSRNSSTGMILSKIEKGSVVLEFGCATGRMTRYMKEVLDCRVYIVEYDASAYEKARPYAEDGLCDDIQNFRWAQKFAEIRFDAILFADVLEHLTAPEKVLQAAAALLKDTGYLYASIPNITHNDIILKACAERFDYTRTGLLDDSHVHFWGMENIREIAGQCGLAVQRIEGTHCATGDTEQQGKTGNILLQNILRERQCGEIYQFVVTLRKGEAMDVACDFPVPVLKSHLYLDTGKGFNPEEIVAIESAYSGQESYWIHHVIENTQNICAVRLDPVEYQGCILRHLSIRQGGKELSLNLGNGIELTEGIYLPGIDPMVYADVVSGEEPLEIHGEIILPGQRYIQVLGENCCQLRDDADRLLQEKNTAVQEKNIAAQNNRNLQNVISDLSGQKCELQRTVTEQEREKEDLRRDLCAYIILADNKEKYAIALERERDACIDRIQAYQTQVQAFQAQVQAFQAQVQAFQAQVQAYQTREQAYQAQVRAYENRKAVRLSNFIYRVLRKIKRCIKKVLGRGDTHG